MTAACNLNKELAVMNQSYLHMVTSRDSMCSGEDVDAPCGKHGQGDAVQASWYGALILGENKLLSELEFCVLVCRLHSSSRSHVSKQGVSLRLCEQENRLLKQQNKGLERTAVDLRTQVEKLEQSAVRMEQEFEQQVCGLVSRESEALRVVAPDSQWLVVAAF